ETYPENPEVPDVYYPYNPMVVPQLASDGELPTELVGDVPGVANRMLVMPSLIPICLDNDHSSDDGFAYDIHAFGAAGGATQRAGTNFTFGTTGPATIVMDSEGRHAEVIFVNEDEPDIWRIRMHVTGTDGENIVTGVLVPADAP